MTIKRRRWACWKRPWHVVRVVLVQVWLCLDDFADGEDRAWEQLVGKP
jgi:hypothetical protein